MDNIQVGDVVVLASVVMASDGPRMTVDYINEKDRNCWCIWFDKEQKRHRELFSLAALRKVGPASTGVGVA